MINDCNCNIVNSRIPSRITRNDNLTFSVGDTILRFTISIEY